MTPSPGRDAAHVGPRFREDVARWANQSRVPRNGALSGVRIGPFATLGLMVRHPGLGATALFRASAWASRRRLRGLPTVFERLTLLLFGLEISSGVDIGPGLYIAHPSGSMVMANRIGRNATFVHAVTLGLRNAHDFPVLGDGVFVGAGARVLGGVTLGDGCLVGANAVVIDDVPAGATAAGVPARVVRRPHDARLAKVELEQVGSAAAG